MTRCFVVAVVDVIAAVVVADVVAVVAVVVVVVVVVVVLVLVLVLVLVVLVLVVCWWLFLILMWLLLLFLVFCVVAFVAHGQHSIYVTQLANAALFVCCNERQYHQFQNTFSDAVDFLLLQWVEAEQDAVRKRHRPTTVEPPSLLTLQSNL